MDKLSNLLCNVLTVSLGKFAKMESGEVNRIIYVWCASVNLLRGTIHQKDILSSVKQECLKMYLNGMGFRAIERVKGVHHTTVIYWVKQVGKNYQRYLKKNPFLKWEN
jgi:hypothetical protein